MSSGKSLEDRKFKELSKLRKLKEVVSKRRDYICTNCKSLVLSRHSKLVYVPKRRRLCPNCGHEVIKAYSNEAKKFIENYEKQLDS